MDKSLIVFLKNPVDGKVKTRIANTAGNIKALEIYRELLGILNDNLARVNCEVYHYFTETPMDISYWANANYIYKVQKGNELGARMSAAFEDVFRDGGSQKPLKVLIVGSDCPLLSAEIIDEAFLKLDKSDIVLSILSMHTVPAPKTMMKWKAGQWHVYLKTHRHLHQRKHIPATHWELQVP